MSWYDAFNPDWISKRLHGGEATKGLDAKGANTDYAQSVMRYNLGGVENRQAPTATAAQLGAAAQLDGGPQDQARAQQQQTAGFLQGVMSGQNAGAGEIAVNRQVGQAQAAQQAQARMARGPMAALAARGMARNQADINLAGAGQAAQAQMQDQQGAAGQLGGVLQGMRGQDLDFAGQNAQFQQQRMLQQGAFNQQTGLANQASQLQMTGMNDQAMQGYLQGLTGLDQAEYQRELAKRQIMLGDRGSAGNVMNSGGGMIAQYAGQNGQK
jgi:hypothetical protein